MKYNDSTGVLVFTMTSGDKVKGEYHRVLHRSPLRLEAWDTDVDGQRITGVSKAKEAQKNLNIMIDKATSSRLFEGFLRVKLRFSGQQLVLSAGSREKGP